jgi:putative tricarboxylic transport membrane protein
MKKNKTAKNTSSMAPVIAIACFVVVYITTGYMTLGEESRHVPLLTAYVTIFLLILETLKRCLPSLRGIPKDSASDDEEAVTLGREITGLLYTAGLAASIYLMGFYVATPLYLFVAVAYMGKQPKKSAALIAVIASVAIYVIFEFALETHLYKGLFFS